eukprot:5108831-Pyramimonas_sp.AAC.1
MDSAGPREPVRRPRAFPNISHPESVVARWSRPWPWPSGARSSAMPIGLPRGPTRAVLGPIRTMARSGCDARPPILDGKCWPIGR